MTSVADTPPPLFSANGDTFIVASADGIIKLFDTGTGRLKVSLGGAADKTNNTGVLGAANGHLIERHTCLAWVSAGKSKKKKTNARPVLLLAGTASGDVKAYDAQLGELRWRASGVVEGGVHALAYSSANPSVVMATGASGQIITISLEDGQVAATQDVSKHAITCLAVSPDGRHVYGGGSSLALYSADQLDRVARFTGHTMPASCAAFSPDASYAVSCSSAERQVTLWPTPQACTSTTSTSADTKSTKTPGKTPGKTKGQQTAAAVLPMDQPAVHLDTCEAASASPGGVQGDGYAVTANGHVDGDQVPSTSGNLAFCVCAVSETGEAYVWLCSKQQGADSIQGQLLAKVHVPKRANSELQDTVLGAKLQTSKAGVKLLVARGSTAIPVFDTISVPSTPAATASEAVISLKTNTIDSTPAKTSTPASGKSDAEGNNNAAPATASKRSKADVTVVGPGTDAAVPTAMRTAGVPAVGSADVDMADVEADEQEDDDAPPEELEPLGARVAALQAAAGTGVPAHATNADAAVEASGPAASDKANSLAVLMTQALRSNDRVLLERCLSATAPSVIANTMARLLPIDAAAFLRAAVDRLLSTPARAGQLAPWIKATLHHHTGYIMTAPGAQAPLAALYQAIDARVGTYQQLLRLHGRLGLITAHNRAVQRVQDAAGTGQAGAPGQIQPEVVFEDDEDDDAEVEDPFALPAGDIGSDEGDDDDEGLDGDGFGDDDDLDGDEDDGDLDLMGFDDEVDD